MKETLNRISKNNRYYDMFFENVKARTENRNYSYLLQRFTDLLPENSYILDIGCGTGEHLKYFQDNGYEAIGIEPSEKMRDFCIQQNLQVVDGTFETLPGSIEQNATPIGGIWCAASLLHVPLEEFHSVITTIFDTLVQNGVFFFTVRLGEGYKWDKYDAPDADAERFIQLFHEDFLDHVLQEVGFMVKLKLIEESYWGRPTYWISYICEKK